MKNIYGYLVAELIAIILFAFTTALIYYVDIYASGHPDMSVTVTGSVVFVSLVSVTGQGTSLCGIIVIPIIGLLNTFQEG